MKKMIVLLICVLLCVGIYFAIPRHSQAQKETRFEISYFETVSGTGILRGIPAYVVLDKQTGVKYLLISSGLCKLEEGSGR